MDLLPTLMGLAGVEKSGMGMHGHSLKPLMTGRAKKWPRQYAFSSTFIRNGGPLLTKLTEGGQTKELREIMGTTAVPTVTDKRWTYIAYGEKGRPELYDFRTDLDQRKNVIAQNPRVRLRMEEALAEFLVSVGTPDTTGDRRRPTGGPDYARP